MDQDSRRLLHHLTIRALDKDSLATARIEEMIIGFDRSGSAGDVEQALQILVTVGDDELYKRVIALLQENDEAINRLQRPLVVP